jgi:hypothetical protein
MQHGWKTRHAYNILVGKPEEKRLPGRLRCRRQGNIRIGHTEKRWKGMDWVHLAQDRDQW